MMKMNSSDNENVDKDFIIEIIRATFLKLNALR